MRWRRFQGLLFAPDSGAKRASAPAQSRARENLAPLFALAAVTTPPLPPARAAAAPEPGATLLHRPALLCAGISRPSGVQALFDQRIGPNRHTPNAQQPPGGKP